MIDDFLNATDIEAYNSLRTCKLVYAEVLTGLFKCRARIYDYIQ